MIDALILELGQIESGLPNPPPVAAEVSPAGPARQFICVAIPASGCRSNFPSPRR